MRLGTATALGIGILGAAAVAGCRSGVNYSGPLGPRYAGGVALAPPAEDAAPDTIRLVTFNIQYARRIDSAIALLESAVPLTHADIVTLQEMDAAGTRRIAEALGMSWVYYPATVSPAAKDNLGARTLARPGAECAWSRKILGPQQGRALRAVCSESRLRSENLCPNNCRSAKNQTSRSRKPRQELLRDAVTVPSTDPWTAPHCSR